MNKSAIGKEGGAFKIKDDGTIVRVDEPNNQPHNTPNPPPKRYGWVWLILLVVGGVVAYAVMNPNFYGDYNRDYDYETNVVTAVEDGTTGATVVNEDFREFIRKFESDPNFQLSRVHFSQARVSREDWGFWNDIYEGYREDENGTSYVGNLIEYSDYWKWEYYIPNSGFHIQMNFTMTDGKWYVSYYHYYNN